MAGLSKEVILCLPGCDDNDITPIGPCIYMTGDGSDDVVEDVGWQSVDEAPILVERGEIGRDGRELEVVATSERECVVIPMCS